MSLSMYQASVPVVRHMLGNLATILTKAEAYASERKIDPSVLLQYRIAPDMFPLIRQVQIVSDTSKGGIARLAGAEIPKFEDVETTFPELQERIAKTIRFVDSFRADQIDRSEDREIKLQLGPELVTFKGQTYLLHFMLPNFYFHIMATYAILRHCGVDVGKRDFLGSF
jgi:hypothetical protein